MRFPGIVELSGYISNAWDYEYGSPQAAVEAFLEDSPESAESAALAITELLACCTDEQDRQLLLRDFGWGYAPADTGQLDEFLKWTRTALLESELPT